MTEQAISRSVEDERQRAIEVLRGTDDGDALSPADLSLLQAVVNGGVEALSEKGVARWDEVCQAVASGNYRSQWFHGVENLTRDHSGYVKWRGKTVEHYSYPVDRASEERVAAQMLGSVCARLERDGIPVSSSEVLGLYGRMRFAGEMGPDLPRCVAVFRRGSTTGLDLRIERLKEASDEALSREITEIVGRINVDRPGGQGPAEFSALPLITKQDYDVVVNAIKNSAEWGRRVVWQAGALTPAHPLYNEPAESLGALMSCVSRASLIDEAAVQIQYLGASFAEPPKDEQLEVERPRGAM